LVGEKAQWESGSPAGRVSVRFVTGEKRVTSVGKIGRKGGKELLKK